MKRKYLPVIYLVILLSFVICERKAAAQKIYLLVAADTKDPKIGVADEMDLWNVGTTFLSHVPEDQLVAYSEPTSNSAWTGPSVQNAADMKSAILDAIGRCPAGSNDTIVFYWSGHGAYDAQGHYLKMPNNKPLYRSEVVAAIRRKSPRLSVVISDSCNTLFESRRLGGVPCPAMEPPLRLAPLFNSLFIQCSGLVDINAASEGEEARCMDTCGGYFTSSLMSWDEKYDREGRPLGRGFDVEVTTRFGRKITKEIPLGYFWKHAEKRNSWNDVITHVNQTMRTHWRGITDQTIRVWSLPNRVNNPPITIPGNLPQVLSLTRNDVILTINGNAIRGEEDCRREVRNSGRIMQFTVRDSRDGTIWRMETRLRATEPRFGVYPTDAQGDGALVTRVRFGSPATQNSVLEKIIAGNQQPPVRPPQGRLPKILSLTRGDVILSVNGQPINGRNDCIRAVNNSPQQMIFTVRDANNGAVWRMRTTLRRRGFRFGVDLRDAQGGGAYVTSVSRGSPATNNEVLERIQ